MYRFKFLNGQASCEVCPVGSWNQDCGSGSVWFWSDPNPGDVVGFESGFQNFVGIWRYEVPLKVNFSCSTYLPEWYFSIKMSIIINIIYKFGRIRICFISKVEFGSVFLRSSYPNLVFVGFYQDPDPVFFPWRADSAHFISKIGFGYVFFEGWIRIRYFSRSRSRSVCGFFPKVRSDSGFIFKVGSGQNLTRIRNFKLLSWLLKFNPIPTKNYNRSHGNYITW